MTREKNDGVITRKSIRTKCVCVSHFIYLVNIFWYEVASINPTVGTLGWCVWYSVVLIICWLNFSSYTKTVWVSFFDWSLFFRPDQFPRMISVGYVLIKLITITSFVLSLHFSYPPQWTLSHSSEISYFHWYSTMCCCCCCCLFIYFQSIFSCLVLSFYQIFRQKEPNSISTHFAKHKTSTQQKRRLYSHRPCFVFSFSLFCLFNFIRFLCGYSVPGCFKIRQIRRCLQVCHFPLHHFINRFVVPKVFAFLLSIFYESLLELLDALELFYLFVFSLFRFILFCKCAYFHSQGNILFAAAATILFSLL